MLKTDRTGQKMLKCRKVYFDIPFAHRQHMHDGHCSFVHGHNWDIAITFACDKTDENGFVVDFGKLKFIKGWIDENLDHACVFSKSDPLWRTLRDAAPEAWKICLVDECSCEGLAKYFFEVFGKMVSEATSGRARVAAVEVSEDKKNTAKYTPDSL